MASALFAQQCHGARAAGTAPRRAGLSGSVVGAAPQVYKWV